MRFKLGDKVEVMNNKEVPVSWNTAEILSGSARTCGILYDSYHCMKSDQIGETVPRRFLAPYPLVQNLESCVAGDIVEVFYLNSWRTAIILDIVGGKKENKRNMIHLHAAALQKQYLVRLVGVCSEDLVMDGSNIRMRQIWDDDKWALMEKSSRAGDVIAIKPSKTNCCQKMNYQVSQFKEKAKSRSKKDCRNILDHATFPELPVISSRPLKRMSPYGLSIVEAHNGRVQKLRAIEKEGWMQRVVATPVVEKVDAVAYPKEISGEKDMHTSFNIISNGYNRTKRTKRNDVLGYSGVGSPELSSSDSNACSVGSCSVTDRIPKNCYSPFRPMHCQDTDTLCSDAESSYGLGSGRKSLSLLPKEELEVSVHRLELHAYRSTLEALYACGPLSWTQEAMLTNLRILLHISNDEHLKELKHLISTKTTISVN